MNQELWPHQKRAIDELIPKIEHSYRSCVVSPTGGGKTKILTELLELGHRSVIYTNRKMLLEQLARNLDEEGFEYGIRAAGYKPATIKTIQLASIQTENSRVTKKKQREVHDADLVLIDEAHLNKERTMQDLLKRHGDVCVIGFTATPVNIGHIYNEFVIAGTKSELRKCGALVPAYTYAPDEPDMSRYEIQDNGEFKHKDVVKAIQPKLLYGRVEEHWRRLNPNGMPALLFAPGKAESLWFAQEFSRHGIRSAHIDGNEVWLDGEFYSSSHELRDEVRKLSEAGDVKIVCNRFVMREGINWPFLYHGIFATVFGSLSSYLQSGGRLLRAHPSMDRVILQDHGGNWHRHGSMNIDREWHPEDDSYRMATKRVRQLKLKEIDEPILCPQCFAPRLSGPVCHECGYRSTGKTRIVRQSDGKLVEKCGDIYKEPRTYKKSDAQLKWDKCYWRCLHSNRTFRQARGLFQYENWGMEPPQGLSMMPRHDDDWYSKVKAVPRQLLT